MASTPNRHTKTSTQEEEEEDCMFAMQLASAAVVPMALKAAIELDLLEIMARAGPGAYLSTAQIATQLPTNNPDASTMLDRILRVLASHSILTFSYVIREDGSTERLYGMAPVCKFLTRTEMGSLLLPFWYYLKDAVLEGGVPFYKAHGMSEFE
ncbi:caffeic acid 3-O-methyltransferase [Cinnamomum micranthum f. kanehirae]|uniref:Caffeic acid 3-O-methyltransferase n=1 Tax=Cinnamomum micranthum f. kanehirae TaxID=337451 RepID=A0A3S3N1J4_9MAGN|nr:caffeic acid 3-O-methyltransferase [Cinnamomum micranthum f. kanehirae]